MTASAAPGHPLGICTPFRVAQVSPRSHHWPGRQPRWSASCSVAPARKLAVPQRSPRCRVLQWQVRPPPLLGPPSTSLTMSPSRPTGLEGVVSGLSSPQVGNQGVRLPARTGVIACSPSNRGQARPHGHRVWPARQSLGGHWDRLQASLQLPWGPPCPADCPLWHRVVCRRPTSSSIPGSQPSEDSCLLALEWVLLSTHGEHRGHSRLDEVSWRGPACVC